MLNSLFNFTSAEKNRIQFNGHLDTKEHPTGLDSDTLFKSNSTF